MSVKDKLSETLQALGFTEREALIYLTVLELKEALPASIARLSGVKRPWAYFLLERLAQKGLLSSVKKNGHLVYQAKNPHRFIQEQKQKSELLKTSVEALSMDLSKLLTLHESSEEKVEVFIFRGEDGLTKLRKEIVTFKGRKKGDENPENEVLIRNGSVAIISWKNKLGVVIQNRDIANVARSINKCSNSKGRK